jgi:hypothetical protein
MMPARGLQKAADERIANQKAETGSRPNYRRPVASASHPDTGGRSAKADARSGARDIV